MCIVCMCLCVCFCRGKGGRQELQCEREREMEKRAFGAPCPALAWFLHIPCRKCSVISFTPHSFSSLGVKHMHAHTGPSPQHARGPNMSRLIYFNSVIQQKYSVIIQKDAMCCLDATSFFSISTHTQRWRGGTAVSSGCWQPAKLAAFLDC